jgi:hypothetical protein
VVNANLRWLNNLSCVFLSAPTHGLNSVTDIPISQHRENCNSLSDLHLALFNYTHLLSGVLLIVDRLDVDGQSFAPIDLHETDAASLLVAHKMALHLLSKDENDQVQLQN